MTRYLHVCDERKIALDIERHARLKIAFAVSPHTGHKPGHKYTKVK